MNINDKVRFIHSTKIDKSGKEQPKILKGKIEEYAKSGGYIIRVTSEELNGTLCNRGELDILEVIK